MVKKWIIEEFLVAKRKSITIGMIVQIISCLLALVTPKLLGFIIDSLEMQSLPQNTIIMYALLMLLLAAITFVMKFIWRYMLLGSSRDLECFLRDKLFAHLQSLPVKFYNNKKTGDLMSYATNDLSAVRMAFANIFTSVLDGVVMNFASIFIMSQTINPILTVIAILPAFCACFIIVALRGKIRAKFLLVQRAFADISDKVQENITGIRVVKAYVQENAEIEKINKASLNRKDIQMDYVRLSAALNPLINICFGVSYALVLIVGSRFVINGTITLGDFISVNAYIPLLTRPITQLGRIVEVVQRASASIKRLDEIFMTRTDIIDNNPTFSGTKFNGKIEVRNLTFTYPGTNIEALHDINLTVEPGKTLAIIGKTGCGKSTLVNLLLRLYNIERGKIFIDGVDVNDIPLATLRENIGYVPQDNFLFSTTITENIRFFNKNFTMQQVEEAARFSSVYDNIIDFPEGFDTVVGERGITLSGGQKQRISIARAVIKDPSILILDDSLSAVDTKTEEEILANIRQILQGRTGILIAHRISTIKHADEIIVMDDGRIVERGTHESLLAQEGMYYRLYQQQLAEINLEKSEEFAI